MVVLCVAICTRAGKALLSRIFVGMTRVRIEGLLAAFPKLMGTGKQHTFVDTENVRYVYQPLESLYLLLVTNKSSNIVEDLETLHTCAKVVPEYCKVMDEDEILKNAFELTLAFDEVISPTGYKENVTVPQIRQYIEMDSHEEKIFEMVERNKQEEAAKEMKRQQQRIADMKQKSEQNFPSSRSMSGSGGGGMGYDPARSISNTGPVAQPYVVKETSSPTAKGSPSTASIGKGLQLGSKNKIAATPLFETLKKEEGLTEELEDSTPSNLSGSVADKNENIASESVHLSIEERVSVIMNKPPGGLQNMEIKGDLNLAISDAKNSKISIALTQGSNTEFQFKTHPNINKQLFQDSNTLALKELTRGFPVGSPLGILKWRWTTKDESSLPLTVSCWPSVTKDNVKVVIEYELTQPDFVLDDVSIVVPLPNGTRTVIVETVTGGTYTHNQKRNMLEWQLPVIEKGNNEGNIEFTVPKATATDADFFPININFSSKKTFCEIEILSVVYNESKEPVKYSQYRSLKVDQFSIV